MAVTHIYFNSGSEYGAKLRSHLTGFESAFDGLIKLKNSMALMLNGDGTNATHFPYITTKFGFATDADAKAAWDELNSVLFKLTTDASVSSVNAAILQLFNKLR